MLVTAVEPGIQFLCNGVVYELSKVGRSGGGKVAVRKIDTNEEDFLIGSSEIEIVTEYIIDPPSPLVEEVVDFEEDEPDAPVEVTRLQEERSKYDSTPTKTPWWSGNKKKDEEDAN